MKYKIEHRIEAPRAQVVALFSDPENMKAWQETLLSYAHLSGEPGQAGAVTKLVHRFGKKRIEMTETIEYNRLPDALSVVYEAKSAWNRVIYSFREAGPEATDWEMDCEFRCRGMLRVMAFLAPGMFRRTTEGDMQRFKAFCEG